MDTPQTPMQQDQANTGRIRFSLRTQNLNAFETQMRIFYDIPTTNGDTTRAMPPASSLPKDKTEPNNVLIDLDASWCKGQLPLENNPHVVRLTDAQYRERLPEVTE